MADFLFGITGELTSSVNRPSYNTGTGFYIGEDKKLYDAAGNPFLMRGLCVTHPDWPNTWDSIPATKANAVATNLWWGEWPGLGRPRTADEYVDHLIQVNIDRKIVPLLNYGMQNLPEFGGSHTPSQDPADHQPRIDQWIAQKTAWDRIEKWAILQIGGEFGAGSRLASATSWRDNWIDFIGQMRSAGYTHLLSIGVGADGQAYPNVIDYGQEVFDSDPQKNIIFDWHLYNTAPGGWPPVPGYPANPVPATGLQFMTEAMDAMLATGLPFYIAEYGPPEADANNNTDVTVLEIMQESHSRGIGWLSWCWDVVTTSGYAMCTNLPGLYTQTSDLTVYGQTVVENPTYGLQAIATPASVFA